MEHFLEAMPLLTPEHLLLMTSLLCLQVWREAGAQTVCPHNEPRCNVNGDTSRIYMMECSGYGALQQLPSACAETRIIANLVIYQGTTVDRLQHRILDGLNVRQLELVGLGITSIDVTAFQALSSHLEVLHLQDNQLESLPLGVFRPLTRLSRLQLHNNRLTQVSSDIFSGLTNLVYLTLNVNRLTAVDRNTWYSLPRLVTLILEDNRLGEGGLVFPHGGLRSLEELRLDKNRLGVISDDIISALPNLRRLYFRSNGIESLPHLAFHANPRLEEVYLSSNNISQLTAGSFSGAESLTKLVLDGNYIRQLPGFLFDSLGSLQILSLRNNNISDIDPNSLIGLLELRELDLSGNRIPILPLGTFDPLGQLEKLSVANNEIQQLDVTLFQSCRNLLTLDLANNAIPSVSADSFVSTIKLTVLKLSHNKIEHIYAGTFDQLQLLEELDLSDNYLSDLGNESFAYCQSLQKLYLSSSLLTNISRHSLEAATSLQKLDLADNNIADIEAGALSSLASLNWMNLSRNLLTGDQLTIGTQSAPSDIVVDVSWNRITSIVSLSTPLGGIYLSGNPLNCSCESPSWISLANTSRFLDATITTCCSDNTPDYLLCYWSRCGLSAEHQLCLSTDFDADICQTTITTVRPMTTVTATITKATTTPVESSAVAIETTTTEIIDKTEIDLRIWTNSNETAISVTWTAVNATDQIAYYWLICFDDDNRQVASAEVEGQTYVIGNLLGNSTYNICITAVTNSDHMDPTRCVVVATDGPPDDRNITVIPTMEDSGVYPLIVVAIAVGCLIILLIIICIAVVVCYRRRRRQMWHRKLREAKTTTSSSSGDSPTGNSDRNPMRGRNPWGFSSTLSQQSVATIDMYEDAEHVNGSEQPATTMNLRDDDVTPAQTSISLNSYDLTLTGKRPSFYSRYSLPYPSTLTISDC